MEVMALRSRLSGVGFKSPAAATLKRRCGEHVGKVAFMRQMEIQEASESELTDERIESAEEIETRDADFLWDKFSGCLMIGKMISGVQGARIESGRLQ
jgi:hypothetical protein